MRTKVTLLLIFLNVVLLYVIFYLRDPSGPDTDASLVLGAEAIAPEQLMIEAGKAKIHLQHRDDRWIITEPIAWSANDFAVRYILNELRTLRAENTFSVEDLPKSNQTLADYGLEKPALVLTLTPAAKAGTPATPIHIRIGDATKQGNRLYILSPDEKRIHVVSKSLAERLGMSVSELRSEALFSISSFEAQALTLEVPPAQRTLFRRDAERWNIETLQSRASRVDTELTIGKLNALHLARFFTPANPEEFKGAFTTPALRITLEASNRRRETLLIGPAAPAEKNSLVPDGSTAYLAKMEDDSARGDTLFVVNVPNELMATMRRAQMELREKHIFDFAASDVSSIGIKSPNDPELSLQKLDRASNASASLWQVSTRSGDLVTTSLPAEPKVVENLLKDLNRLVALEFTNDAPSQSDRESYGFTRPASEVTLSLAGKAGAPVQTVTLLIGVGTDHRTYASLANKEPVYRISDDTLTEIPVQVNDFRERVVWSLPAGAQVTALKITDLVSSTTVVDAPLPGPQGTSLEPVITAMRTLHARRFPGTPFSAQSYDGRPDHVWRYRAELTVALQGASQNQTALYTVLLSERIGGDLQTGATPSDGLVFELDSPLIDSLFKLLVHAETPAAAVGTPAAPTPTATPTTTPTPAPAPTAIPATP